MQARAIMEPVATCILLLSLIVSFLLASATAALPSRRSSEWRSSPARRLVKGKRSDWAPIRKVLLIIAVKANFPHRPHVGRNLRKLLFGESRQARGWPRSRPWPPFWGANPEEDKLFLLESKHSAGIIKV